MVGQTGQRIDVDERSQSVLARAHRLCHLVEGGLQQSHLIRASFLERLWPTAISDGGGGLNQAVDEIVEAARHRSRHDAGDKKNAGEDGDQEKFDFPIGRDDVIVGAKGDDPGL